VEDIRGSEALLRLRMQVLSCLTTCYVVIGDIDTDLPEQRRRQRARNKRSAEGEQRRKRKARFGKVQREESAERGKCSLGKRTKGKRSLGKRRVGKCRKKKAQLRRAHFKKAQKEESTERGEGKKIKVIIVYTRARGEKSDR
jgi:hypothetical protein